MIPQKLSLFKAAVRGEEWRRGEEAGKFVQDTVGFAATLRFFMKINIETNKDLVTASGG